MFEIFKYFSFNCTNLNLFFFCHKFKGFNHFFLKLVVIYSGVSLIAPVRLGYFSVYVKRCINSFSCFYYDENIFPLFLQNSEVQKNFLSLKILRVFLLSACLPCNGQRTKTNARTAKRGKYKVTTK